MPRLVVNPGAPGAWEIQLKPGATLIGRGFANDFKLTDASVSSSHCQVLVENGRTAIKDLGSTNGTFVNGARVTEAVLQAGQTIHLGGVPLAFYADGPVAVAQIVQAAPLPAALAPPPPIPAAASGDTVRLAAPNIRLAAPAAAPRPVAAVAVAAIPAVPPPRPGFVASPVAMPPLAGALPGLDVGSGPCKHHPKTAGRFFCPQCRQFFCEVCVTTKTVGGVTHKGCRHCGAECAPVRVSLQRPVEVGFFARIPGAFAYPFRGSGIFLMIVGIVVVAMVKFGSICLQFGSWRLKGFGLILMVCASGYLFTFLQSIVHSTAAEDREMPELPGISSFADDVLLPFCRFLGLIGFCFGLVILLGVALLITHEPALAWALLPAVILGYIYFPMAFLAVAILDSAPAANPLVVVPSILKVPLEYLVTIVLLSTGFGFSFLGGILLKIIFPEGWTTHSMGVLVTMLASNAFMALMSFYLPTVSVHLLGLLYVSKRGKLAWLDH
jgi:hypothetical protein